MKKILVVVDMQNDFITGSLGSKYAKEKVLPNVLQKVIQHGDNVIFTMDTHYNETYFDSLEGQKLPVPHCCICTEGYELAQSLKNYYCSTGWKHKDIVHKYSFGSIDELPRAVKKFMGKETQENTTIEIVGLCTDICVVSNALILRAKFPNAQIICDASCCGGTSKEAHDAALTVMKSCQIDVINED